jgi:hypothetical protein
MSVGWRIFEVMLPTPNRPFVGVDELGHLCESTPREDARGRGFGRQGVGEHYSQARCPCPSDEFTHDGGGDAAALARRRDGITQLGGAVQRGALPAAVADQRSVVTEEQVRSPLIWFVPLRGGDDDR